MKGKPKPRQPSPLGEALYLVRRGQAPIADVLAGQVGAELAERFLDAATRAVLTDVKSEVRKRAESGLLFAPPRTAVAGFAPRALREVESAPVRHMALLLLTVLECMQPDSKKVASRGLYMGRLAARLNRCERELQRYLAVFRAAAVLDCRQPPSSSGSVKSVKGRCYNVYELCGPMPLELHDTLAAWRKAHAKQQRAATRLAAVAPPAPSRGPLTATAQQTADKFLKRVLDPPS